VIFIRKLGTPPASGWPTDAILQHSFYQPQACIGADRLLPNVPVDGRMLIMVSYGGKLLKSIIILEFTAIRTVTTFLCL